MKTKTRAMLVPLTVVLALFVLPAPLVAADCHTEDLTTQLQCFYSDVDHAKEVYSDSLTGEAFASLAATTECEDGRSIDWADWSAVDDSSCIPVGHEATSVHGSDPAMAYPAGIEVRARVLWGQLGHEGDMGAICVPALNIDDPSTCSSSLAIPAGEGCTTFRAVSTLNTGSQIEFEAAGPWTYC